MNPACLCLVCVLLISGRLVADNGKHNGLDRIDLEADAFKKVISNWDVCLVQQPDGSIRVAFVEVIVMLKQGYLVLGKRGEKGILVENESSLRERTPLEYGNEPYVIATYSDRSYPTIVSAQTAVNIRQVKFEDPPRCVRLQSFSELTMDVMRPRWIQQDNPQLRRALPILE